ncbi:hypothetical protein [Vagococcus silagei]|uniref:Uncharacterized protein n=2 Tax=Vagococcus silagei TaxID=2508885 RepID=A0A4S3B2E1_9ENTE|nr:hypothetical protein ESZ54_08325 [Vagococcus silagei]
MQLSVTILENETIIQHDNEDLTLTITPKPHLEQINLGISGTEIVGIGTNLKEAYDTYISLAIPWEIEQSHLMTTLAEIALDSGVKLKEQPKLEAIAKNHYPQTETLTENITKILNTFGYSLIKIKKKPAKAVHRWSKDIANIDFYVDYKGAKAVCRWQKRQEMLIKKGAQIVVDPPLNKDGSLGFAAKFTLSIRELNQAKIKNGMTTEDIILKSVNEVGNFLYFAGTNSWLVLKDKDGKTIDEYTVVK